MVCNVYVYDSRLDEIHIVIVPFLSTMLYPVVDDFYDHGKLHTSANYQIHVNVKFILYIYVYGDVVTRDV